MVACIAGTTPRRSDSFATQGVALLYVPYRVKKCQSKMSFSANRGCGLVLVVDTLMPTYPLVPYNTIIQAS